MSDEVDALCHLASAGGVRVITDGGQQVIMRKLVGAGHATSQATNGTGDVRYELTEAGLAALEARASELAGCTEGSPEEALLKEIADALDAYEAKRGPRI